MKPAAFVLAMALGIAGASAQTPKKRIAILNFDYATVSTSVSAIFGTNRDVGKGIADLLVEKLVASGVYSVFERNAIQKVLNEQNLANSDRADPLTASKIGRLLGVDAIVIGSITQFGRDDKNTSVGGGVASRQLGRFGLGGVGRRESKAVVNITARMVDATTGQILGTASGAGESKRSGATLLGAGGSSAAAAGGAFDMTSKNFANTLLGEAVTEAVAGLARNLEQQSARLPVHAVEVEGLVADVSGTTLVLNVGSKAGVKAGDRLTVKRPVREIRDPASGKVIRRIEENVGEVVVTEVDELSAVGTFSGTAAVKAGDVVRTAK